MVVIAVRDRIRYELDLGDLIDSAIYYDGCFEPNDSPQLGHFSLGLSLR